MNNFSTLLKIAWRNIWRSRLRSFVVIGAVVVGIWAVIFMSGWMTGMVNGYINNAINNEISHIQIHHKKYREDKEAKYFMKGSEEMMKTVQSLPQVKASTQRTMVNGMLMAAHGNQGIRMIGVQPKDEALVTKLDQKVKEGEYFPDSKSRKVAVLISQQTADKLQLKVRSKVALQFQSLNGDVRLGCKVVGIYKGSNSKVDEMTLFIQQEDLNRAFSGMDEPMAHEIALLVNDMEQMPAVKARLQEQIDYQVEDYKEISPDVAMMESQISMTMLIFLIIIMVALVFGIINTMLMAILERGRELGVLMAVGMKRAQVFGMIVTETVLLSALGAPIGMLLGALTMYLTHKYGIDLSAYSDALQQFGMTELIRPQVDPSIYWQTAIAIVITAILGAIYPALKAIRLKPIEAIRKI